MPIKVKREILEDALNKRGKTHNWFAKFVLKCSSGFLSQLLNGHRNPSVKMTKKILKYFEEYSYDDLFTTVQRKLYKIEGLMDKNSEEYKEFIETLPDSVKAKPAQS